jgi:HD-GYP domain-containing protein (c-di-GMP phosphodiesterase class II)
MTVLVKVSYDELLYSEILEFDLFAANGELVCPMGSGLPAKERSKFQEKSLYRNVYHFPIRHEGVVYLNKDAPLTAKEREERILEDATPSIYGEQEEAVCVNAIQSFWEQLQRGVEPDVALCEVARDQLVSEIISKVDELRYLSELRVRDHFTYSHTLDVASVSIALAIKLGYDKKHIQEIALASILHDLGKLLIPKAIMFKASRLTEKEFDVMKLHPELGYKIIVNELRLPKEVALPALEHQEMYAGGGYPQNLKGDEIHPYSHIVKIADVYDALTSKRPYKEPIPSSKAIKIMLSEGNRSFHPEFLKAFIEVANYQDADAPVTAASTAE